MKLRNKKTGGLIEIYVAKDQLKFRRLDNETKKMTFNSLAELNEEWEDYEEPKDYWYIDCDGEVYSTDRLNVFDLDRMLNIDNRFNSREEAEKAVEKLKAWKRLKDKGFRFILDGETEMPMFVYSGANGEKCIISAEESKQCRNDIKLLFGGEE